MIKPGLLNRIPGIRRLTNRLGDVAPDEGFFSRLARWTQRRPWLVVGGVLLILGILAAPALRMELRSSGAQLLPPSSPDRQFFDTLAEEYPASGIPTIQVVGQTTAEEMAPLAESIRSMDGVALVPPPRPVGEQHAVVNVYMTDSDPGSAAAKDVVADGARATGPITRSGSAVRRPRWSTSPTRWPPGRRTRSPSSCSRRSSCCSC